MFPNTGYQMDWDWIDECIDSTPSCFRRWEDYMDEIGCSGDSLHGFTSANRTVFERTENGKLFMSVAF